MKLIQNKDYAPNIQRPMNIFKYALKFNKCDVNKICDEFNNPYDDYVYWCNANYGPVIPTDNNTGWNWMVWTRPAEVGIMAIMYFHSKEDFMAFKVGWL